MSGTPSPPEGVHVRRATADEHAAVLAVFDGVALETDADRIRSAIDADDVFVAMREGGQTVLGALALDGAEITNVAVRRARRDQGIGRALVERARADRERLVAEFDPPVWPFYEALGFEIEPADEPDRLRGRWVRARD